MNTADRSLGQIDYALRRRFAFYTVESDKKVIENDKKLPDSLKPRAIELYAKIENFFKKPENINSDIFWKDVMIGHSYFMAEDEAAFNLKMEFELYPLLLEYCHDGIIVNQELDEGLKKINGQFDFDAFSKLFA
jgi:5-methylcytosine-specific restriction protein B